MNKYKVLSIILSVVSVVSIGGMLYFALGNTKEEPKSKEVTTTSTESTISTSTTESESTTKVSETQQVAPAPIQSSVVVPLAPPSTIASTFQPVETTRTVVHFGKSYTVHPGGIIAGEDRYEVYRKQFELDRQNESKQPTGLGGANLDG